ncbi:alpha/beta hydrolase [Pseudomonas sp. TE3610]
MADHADVPTLDLDRLKEHALAARSQYRALIPLTGAPDPVAQVNQIAVPASHPARIIPARLYLPSRESNRLLPVILFVHGGGFISGDLDTHDVLARAIANGAGALVLSVDYRLAPEHPFPAGLEDVYATLTYAAKQARQWGGDADRLAICGDSAGGNIAAATALLARDRKGPTLRALWLMYATLSNKMDSASWQALGETHFPTRAANETAIAAYVPPNIDCFSPLVAPLWAPLADLPPTLVQVGELDPLRDENIDLAHALEHAGVEASLEVYPGQTHGFIQFFKDKRSHSKGQAALEQGVAYLKAHLD